MVEKVAKETAQQQQQQATAPAAALPQSSSLSGTSFFKRAPKGYESL